MDGLPLDGASEWVRKIKKVNHDINQIVHLYDDGPLDCCVSTSFRIQKIPWQQLCIQMRINHPARKHFIDSDYDDEYDGNRVCIQISYQLHRMDRLWSRSIIRPNYSFIGPPFEMCVTSQSVCNGRFVDKDMRNKTMVNNTKVICW